MCTFDYCVGIATWCSFVVIVDSLRISRRTRDSGRAILGQSRPPSTVSLSRTLRKRMPLLPNGNDVDDDGIFDDSDNDFDGRC